MRNPIRPVRSALALASTLLGVPLAARKLARRVGHPILYRIALPEAAEIHEEPGLLSARTDDLVVVVVARDLLHDEANPVPAAAPARRRLTRLLMNSDLLLFVLLEEEFRNRNRNLKLHDAVSRVRALGGQWAACVHGRLEENGRSGWIDIHATVKDGILYMLVFTMSGGDPGAHEELLARIRDSLVLPG
ncbi:MAG TPA: hypothetical protein VGX50_17240 [Longimicrobium sp.]|jgi:hypothetical protein|nr:hypothetical protein [Longimicrobium sp.]